MLWTYILMMDDTIDRDDAIKIVDRLACIKNWYACMGHAVLLVSDKPAAAICDLLREHFGKRRFLVIDADTDRNGWLPQQAWDLMKQPQPVK